MDRQAFRNRMQQLKQYREQNPGKTYLDFKQYADGREIPPSSTDETTDHPVNKPFIPSIIEAKDTATGKNFSDLTEYEKDLWRRSHGMDHYGKKIARGNLTEVYPEFDIITGIRGAINTVKNVGTSAYKELSVSDAFNKALNKSDKLEVLKNYPELGQVGTTFQYSKYVDDVFPDSKFNGIFYHGGKKGISKFHTPKDKDFILNKGVHSGTKDHGIYFTKDKLSAENYSRSYPKSNRNVYYDLMQEPYARERAKAVDHQYGTDYLKVYDSMLEKYVDIDEYFQLPKPKYKKMERPTIGAQVTPSEGNTMYFNRDMIKTPEDIPNSVVLHEMGHLVDGATGMNNEFLRKLGDKSKFIPFNQAKTMYPNMTRDMYDNILQGTEIKSYMNQFRNYLDQKGKLNRGNYTGSYKNLKKEIIDAPKESFNNIKAIFNLYRSPKLFNKDFQMIPIVNNTNDNTIA